MDSKPNPIILLENIEFQSNLSNHSNYWMLDSNLPNPIILTIEYWSSYLHTLIILTIEYWIPISLIWSFQLLNIGFQSV